jgi:hypothetical protein
MKSKTIIGFSFAILVLSVSTLEVAVANPLRTSMISVNSPTNNYVYSTGDVWLQFTNIDRVAYNFSSYSYSLDGGAVQPTDGNTKLTNLAAGSHKLIIYGNGTNGWSPNQGVLLEIVYFNVNYSEAWVTFTLSTAVFIAVLFLGLLVNRKRLMARLRTKKTVWFWLGLFAVVLASLFVVPLGWNQLNNYLFPHDSRGAVTIYTVPFVFGGLIVMGFGFLFMLIGTRNKNKQASSTKKVL